MHSSYYKYNFISPSSICAQVKEQMKSYFDTGVVDDLLFPIWIAEVMDKFKRAAFDIDEAVLFIDGYTSTLPSDFAFVREAYSCTSHSTTPFRLPGAHYHSISTRLDEEDFDRCRDQCDPCAPEEIHVYYKTQEEVSYTINKTTLLKPGNLSAKEKCAPISPNLHSSSSLTFDVRNKKFLTSFPSGEVYLLYYARLLDEEGYPMIPDDAEIVQAVKTYLQYQLYLQLWDQITDETYNQIQSKVMFYKQQYEEKLYLAKLEAKKDTIYKTIDRIKSSRRDFKKYDI